MPLGTCDVAKARLDAIVSAQRYQDDDSQLLVVEKINSGSRGFYS